MSLSDKLQLFLGRGSRASCALLPIATYRTCSQWGELYPDPPPPTSKSIEVRYHDNRAIYFGIRCFDSDPKTIAANKTRRDRDSFSDVIWLDLDTRGDHRSAWHFEVSAAGVQRDGIRTGDDPDTTINWDWDATWNSAVRRDSEGWTAENAIPLAQLRFQANGGLPWRMELDALL